jgi:hypothetical protein
MELKNGQRLLPIIFTNGQRLLPIIFTNESVMAFLNGHKIQTRRVIKPQPELRKDCKGRYQIGDLLWVKETFRWCPDTNSYCYKASQPYANEHCRKFASVCEHWPKWRSPIHMPCVASRITLEVTDTRIERLQDITFDDCLAEGICYPFSYSRPPKEIERFRDIWNSINAKNGFGWDINPWVQVINFRYAGGRL